MRDIKKSANIYLTIISIIGCTCFLFMKPFQINTAHETVIIFALIGSILLLNHYTIPLPPEGNSISMDSAIYLASLYLFGLDHTLQVLFINAVIYAIYKWKIAWWKHLFNFSIYNLMIISAYYVFIYTGGKIGTIYAINLSPYILSLSIYFIVNMLLINYYFSLKQPDGTASLFSGIIKDKTFLVSYFSTLLLSIMLGILLNQQGILAAFYLSVWRFFYPLLLISIFSYSRKPLTRPTKIS
ncbi:hypothetical protein RCG23_14390 [Neobacillus sp. PS3-34]|nr:hypothetical protein [Neobacillus sp. PS3-34]WML46826.1 hypothetical protein RCG23_14390 [Neobacillus sp. PS3-34]